jgi:DNA mismatch repair protein MutL
MPIRVLPPDVAARIAAGEVIERPASIVKELVENSLDAGASKVTVEVTGGGMTMIRVTDDGCGIAASELATAFERHATSKLADDEDLARVLTLGFRGEALPSIAAVADVELVSRPPQEEAAACLVIGPDRPAEVSAKGAPVGTTMTVKKLFARQPARAKFLRSASSEGGAIAQAVSHYALAYPEVRFQLIADGRQSLHTPGSGDLRDTVAAVYGLDAASQMLAVASEGGAVGVRGLVGTPELTRSNRSYISLFVNRRWIQSRRLTFAVEGAYQGMLMVGRHPLAALDLRVEPGDVDVNVHPTKAEVRFRDESAAFSAVQKAVRAALVTASPVATGVGGPVRPEAPGLTLESPPWTPPLWERGLRHEEKRAGVAIAQPEERPPNGPSGKLTPAETLPVLRVIGQFGGVYIIAEGPEGMYMIDQHAAHERVLYERFVREREARRPDVQGLLEPLPLDLTPRQRSLVEAEGEALAAHGFVLEPFGEGAFVCRSVPAALAGTDLRERIARFLDLMAEEEGDGRDRVAMSLACHGAIRAGKTLQAEEMRELVSQLEAAEAPHTCPHGRPTMVHVSAEMLARGFGRR